MAAPSRRSRTRVPVKLVARIGDEVGETIAVHDISPDGCSVLSRETPEVGARVIVWIGDTPTRMLRMEARVANLVPTEVEGVTRVGVQFVPPHTNAAAQTAAWHKLFRRMLKLGMVDVPAQETVRPTPR